MPAAFNRPFTRIFFDCITLISIFFLPWWVTGICALVGLVFFYHYYEILFIGFIFDSLYAPQSGLWKYAFTLGSFSLLVVEIFVKDRLRF